MKSTKFACAVLTIVFAEGCVHEDSARTAQQDTTPPPPPAFIPEGDTSAEVSSVEIIPPGQQQDTPASTPRQRLGEIVALDQSKSPIVADSARDGTEYIGTAELKPNQ